MGFDIEGARKAGYSDGEIADYLGNESGFDVAGAQKAGYTPAEIVGHLSASRSQPKRQEQEKTAGDAGTIALGDPMGSGAAEIMAAAQPARQSVLEGVNIPEQPFDAAEAGRLSNRAYAETTRQPGTPALSKQEARTSTGPRGVDPNTDRGAALADSSMPVRALAKAAAGGAQGLGGVVRAVGDVTGMDEVAKFGAAAAGGAEKFEAGMGQSGPIAGFGPKSPAPYLKDMGEGAAGSLAQSAALAAVFGPGAVIPAMSVMSAGQEYQQAREQGLEPAMALAGAVPKGVFEAVGEKFTGLDRVAGAMGTLLQKGASDAAKRTAGEVLLRAGVREIPGEVITYLGQTGVDLIPGIGLKQDMTMKDFVDGLRDTAVQAAMMGGAFAGGGHAASHGKPAAKPFQNAHELIRTHWGDAFVSKPQVDPIAAIASANNVDEAIAAAQTAVSSSSAVDNIQNILATQNLAPAAASPAQQAQAAIADIEAGQEPANAPAIAPPETGAPVDATPKAVPTGDQLAAGGDTAAAAALPAEPVTAPVDQRLIPVSRRAAGPTPADQNDATARVESTALAAINPVADAAQIAAPGPRENVQNPAPRAPAQTQAAPTKASEARASAGVQPAATGTPAGNAGLEAARVAPAPPANGPTAAPAPRQSEAAVPARVDPRLVPVSKRVKLDAEQAAPAPATVDPAAAAKVEAVTGEPLDKQWTAFAPDSGTLAVPRADMPQIKAEHRGAMVNFLNARGIAHQQEEVPASSLKPTQAEFSPGKVAQAKGYTDTDRSILVSADGHVLDGHHQWLSRLEAGEPVKVIRLDAPIKQLLETVKEFPSAELARGATAASPASAAPAQRTESVPAARAPQGKQVSFYPGKYGKGMGKEAAKLEAQRLNRAKTDKTINYEAEEHDNPKLENPWAVVGRKADTGKKPAAAPAPATPAEKAAPAAPTEKPTVAPQFNRAAPEPASAAQQATDILDAAGVTGKDRLDALKDVKAGTLTPEEVKAAYPAKTTDQTETPNFKKWFGDSVVTETGKPGGKPLPMYHGTSASEDGQAFGVFDTYASNYGLMGMGGYFTADPAIASSYTKKGRGDSPSVYKVFLAIKNPIDMEAKADAAAWEKQFDGLEDFHESGESNESWYRAAEDMLADQEMVAWEGAEVMQEGLRAMGFDGITHMGGNRVQKDAPRHRVYVAFDPEQIKSATGNNGEFDANNPGIQFSRAAGTGPVPALEAFKTKTGATAFKTPDIALANPRLNVRQPGGEVKRIDYEIRDRKVYAEAIKDGSTPEEARDEASVGIITLDVDAAGVFKSLRNIEVFESKRGNAIAQKVVGGIVESLPAGASLHIHDILPTATGFWDKMGAKFPRSEDTVVTANLTPEQFRSAYDTRSRTQGTRGQPQESRAAEYAGAGSGRPGNDGSAASGLPEKPAAVRNPSTVDRVQAAVAELIGGKQLPNRLGRVVATTASEIKNRWEPILGRNLQIASEGTKGVAQGFYDPATKSVFLIADHITQGYEMGVAAHELMHKYGQTVLGAEGWDKLHSVINSWADADPDSTERIVYTYAAAKVKEVGLELSTQELFPYAVESAINMGIKPSLIAKNGTVARWLGSVKYAMQQAWGKVTGKPETFKTQDLVDLAFGIAQMENPESAAAMGRITDAPVKTDSPEFERWFGDSKVVNDAGKPLVVYHGTTAEFSAFKTGGDGGIHFGTAEAAAWRLADRTGFEDSPGNKIIQAYLSIKNPKEVMDAGDERSWFEEIELAKREGHDGIVYGNRAEADEDTEGNPITTTSWVAFRPEQIKSAIGNNGDFDPSNADIRFSRAPAPGSKLSPWKDATGRMQFAPGAWLYDKIGAAAGPTLARLGLKAASPELRRQLRQMKIDVEKAQETAVAIARETTQLSEAERAMVSDLVEQELKVGVIPPAHAVKLAAMINDVMGRQTDELVALDMLTKDSADKWRGQYLPRYYEPRLRNALAKTGSTWGEALRALTGRQSVMKGIKGKNLKGRGLYETIPEDQLKDYEALGWEARDPDYKPGQPSPDGTVQVWRDFSPAEREKMGEIRDAGFRFVTGYMQSQKDIALGKMFARMADDPEQSSRLEKDGYVQVPTTTVSGTGVKVYGKLAGRWVPMETLSQLSNIEENTNSAWKMYRQAMAVWKMGKTSMNPVSHVNNMVSNLTMAHLAGVSYHRGDKYLAAARDFIKKPAMMVEAKENGLFLGTLSDAELMNGMPEELKILAQRQESSVLKIARTGFDIMTLFLRKPMGAAYQFEDTFFRYLIYKDARENGLEPQDAVDYAQKYIFTYDDLPKGARRIRDFGIPFFSYTYKAAPALLHTALTHPVRMAVPAALFWGINAAAYAIATGDDDDSWQDTLKRYLTDPEFRAKAREKEKLEREHLPPWNKGTTSMLTPKMIRLGMDEVTKLPLFIDVSRIIPGGDLFDVSPNAGGLPIPQPVTPSHPLFTTMVAMLGNKDMFLGKDIVDANDTRGEAASKRSAWLWKQLTPAITAGNYHWERGMNALAQANGGEVKWVPDILGGDATGIGKDGNPVQPKLAAMQTFGVKVRPVDLETAEAIEGSMKRKMIRDIDGEIRKLQRYASKGAISDRTMEKERDKAIQKKENLRNGLTVDGDAKD